MGGSQSTRKLTVENDDPTSVIKVSDDVVQRLKGSQEVRKAAAPPQQHWPAPSAGVPPSPYYFYEPSLTTIQLRQDNLQQLKKNDQYWNQRVRALEDNHKKIHHTMEEEYVKAIEEYEGKHQENESKSKIELPHCLDSKEAVIRCYRSNSKQPMECSKVVQAFQECVENKRSQLLASRG